MGKAASSKAKDSTSGMLNIISNITNKENTGLFLNFQEHIIAC